MAGLNPVERLVGQAQFHALRWMLLRSSGASAGEVQVDGVTMPYLACGSGPAVLMVHGFGADKETWLITARALARNHRVLMMDLPGFGAAGDVPSERGSAKAQAAAVVGFADRMGHHRFHIAGNSMGGGISLRVSHDYPERVRSMTLINSVGPDAESSDVERILDEEGRNPLVPESLDDGDEFLSLVMEKRPKLPRTLQRYALSRSIGRRHRHARMWEGWKNGPDDDYIPAELGGIEAPALVIHGDRDRVIHHSVGSALADQLPNARLEMLRDIGHVPQIEVPKQTAGLLTQFWDSLR